MRIPSVHRDAITLLGSLSDEQFIDLRTNLEKVPAFAGIAELTKHIAETEGLDETDASTIILALFSLYTQLKFHGWTSQELAAGVAHSPDLPKSDEDPTQLAERLQSLLDTEAIVTTGRALDLLTEHEHVFHSARVLTDIRPVFGDDPARPPNGALIVESLKLEYFDEGTTRSLYLALSHGDLRNLGDTIERALDKSGTVQDLLGQIGLPYFDAESEA